MGERFFSVAGGLRTQAGRRWWGPRRLCASVLVTAAASLMVTAVAGVMADRPGFVPGRGALPSHIGAHAGVHGSDSCVSCHAIQTELSHPLGFVSAGTALPAWAPLEQGQMTCLTCHDVSGSDALGGREALLRGPWTGAAFCVSCHEDQSLRVSPHAQATTRAHLAWSGVRHQDTSTRLSAGGLDEESQSCMGCHDGSLAMEAGGGHRTANIFMEGLSPEHPVGVTYGRRFGDAAFGDIPLRPAAALDERVRLFRGNIGCGSCHSPYSHRPDMLVMSNERSALCLTCHAL